MKNQTNVIKDEFKSTENVLKNVKNMEEDRIVKPINFYNKNDAKLLLIDKNIINYETIINAININYNVHYILFDNFDTSTSLSSIFEEINKLNIPSFSCVGLVQHNNGLPRYMMFSEFSIVSCVKSKDPSLKTWKETISFINWLKKSFNIKYFDMMACSIYSDPNWKYIIDNISLLTNVEIRASTDNTGSSSMGGNWFLESHTGVNLKDVYFTDKIEDFKYLLSVEINIRKVYTQSHAIKKGSIVSASPSYELPENLLSNLSDDNIIGIYTNSFASVALKKDGTVVCWGREDYGGNPSFSSNSIASNTTPLTNIVEVYPNFFSFVALKKDGSLVAWGNKNSGGSIPEYLTKSSARIRKVFPTVTAFIAINEEGSLFAWGSSRAGGNLSQSVFDNAGTINKNFVNVLTTVSDDSDPFTGVAAINKDGLVIAWGGRFYGGDISIPSGFSGPLTNVVSVIANHASFCALRADGSIVTWGYPYVGGNTNYPNPVNFDGGVVSVQPTKQGFAALKCDGSVVGWGEFVYGDTIYYIPDSVSSGVVKLFSTIYSLAALKNDGSVVTWGYGSDPNQIIPGLSSDVVNVYTNKYAFFALKNDGSVVTWGNGYSGADVPQEFISELNSGVVCVYTSRQHVSVLKNNGKLLTWGADTNDFFTNVTENVYDVKSMNYNSIAFKQTNSSIKSFDLNEPYFSKVERAKLLCDNNLKYKHNMSKLSGNYDVSADEVRNNFIHQIPSSEKKSFEILIPGQK